MLCRWRWSAHPSRLLPEEDHLFASFNRQHQHVQLSGQYTCSPLLKMCIARLETAYSHWSLVILNLVNRHSDGMTPLLPGTAIITLPDAATVLSAIVSATSAATLVNKNLLTHGRNYE